MSYATHPNASLIDAVLANAIANPRAWESASRTVTGILGATARDAITGCIVSDKAGATVFAASSASEKLDAAFGNWWDRQGISTDAADVIQAVLDALVWFPVEAAKYFTGSYAAACEAEDARCLTAYMIRPALLAMGRA